MINEKNFRVFTYFFKANICINVFEKRQKKGSTINGTTTGLMAPTGAAAADVDVVVVLMPVAAEHVEEGS